METRQAGKPSVERSARVLSGWPMLFFNLVLLIGTLVCIVLVVVRAARSQDGTALWWLIPALLVEALAVFLLCGFFTLQPNEARVLILFGAYKGTVRRSGFFWGNPFYARVRARVPVPAGSVAPEALKAAASRPGGASHLLYRNLSAKLSLRARNFNSDKLKVNDKRGNPIEIAAVIVWRVDDTARAAFDVDEYESYVHIQSEAAIRHIASLYGYDHGEENEPTLRDSADEVAQGLKRELEERLDKAGVAIEEARLTHLAYAPEIAQAMLRRQQAGAVIAARK